MNIKTLFSTQDSLEQAMLDLEGQYQAASDGTAARLVLFFSTSFFDPRLVSEKMQGIFPGASVAGCTTAGELVSGRMLKRSIVAMVFGAEAVKNVAVGVIKDLDGEMNVGEVFDSFEQVFGPLGTVDLKKHVGIVLIDGLSGAEERVMEKIGDRTNITFIGGSAGDDAKFEQTFVFADGQAYSGAAVLVLVQLEREFDVLKTQSFVDSGKRLVATQVDEAHREVIEFNDRPAAGEYAEQLGTTIEEVDQKFMSHPVGLMIGAEPYVRSPQRLIGNKMKFYCNVRQGADLSILDATDIVEETRRALAEKRSELGPVSAILNFHCILRTLELEKKQQTEAYGQIFSDIPMIGFSTYGEEYIGHINQTSTMLIFK